MVCLGAVSKAPTVNMPFSPRRFPPPWSAEEVTANCFAVIDANEQKLACDRGCATGEGALKSLYVGTRVAQVCDYSVAWGDSICGRRRRRDAALACSMMVRVRERTLRSHRRAGKIPLSRPSSPLRSKCGDDGRYRTPIAPNPHG